MSRVDSPFHAIAAEALDDSPDDVPKIVANGSAASTIATRLEAKGQERESVKPPLELNAEDGDIDTADKNEIPEQEPEHTPLLQERKVSFEGGAEVSETVTKKSKKRTNVWTKTTSRKSAKKVKNNGVRQSDTKDDNVLLKPFHQEDDPSYPILLSKIYKAEKIDLSADRLTASGSKGYRMVRATRGVLEGAWYFEIYVDKLGDTGHTRLGWSTRRGDLQAPVGYDAHSYSYRDLDGSKVHAALREGYGDAFREKDVIGFYINLPRGPGFTQKPEEEVVGYKGQPYIIIADEPLKALPGSEILFFKNGECQGVAFKDVNDGTYFPAASMYTLPSQDCCKVVFNFGPDFRYPVTDLGDRPLPSPMFLASGPGEARMETVPTTQTEAVVDSTVNGGGKWMAPEVGNAKEVEEAPEPTGEGNSPKEVAKVPPVPKKKVKRPEGLVGNHIAPHSSKTFKAGGFKLHPESKADANLKAFKNGTVKLGVGASGFLSEKGAKKDTAGTGFPIPGGIHKDKGFPNVKGIPKNKGLSDPKGLDPKGMQKVKGKSVLEGSQKDNGPSLKGSKKVLSATEMPSGRVKQDMFLMGISSVQGTASQGLNGNQKDFLVKGSQNFQENNKDSTVAGLQSSKGSKRERGGSGLPGLPKSKQIRRDLPGTESVFNTSKDFTGTGLAVKAFKKDLLGMGSGLRASKKELNGTGPVLKTDKVPLGAGAGHKPSKTPLPGSRLVPRPRKDLPGAGSDNKPTKKNFSGSGYLHRGFPASSSSFVGPRSWGDGIRGTTMDVDVVVVESSAPTQDEGPFR